MLLNLKTSLKKPLKKKLKYKEVIEEEKAVIMVKTT